ncbi:MAG: integrase arm-type DNA-binding domain-containing protein [Alphaproteobacteria bacterium]|nr:integrase arm-type DNA-binding domain-containing protein [Alphaproteobacteria bacterium]
MTLTNTECKNAKPSERKYRLYDTAGLYLEIMPNGSKYWRLKYRYLNKEKVLALGIYPVISLAEAREGRDRARKLLAAGSDPSQVKQEKRQQAIVKAANTFEVVAREWHENQKGKWTPKHAVNVTRRLEVDVFPYIGNRPISEIDPPELLNSVLRKIEKREALDVVARVKQICGQIFRYGIATGKCTRDPSTDLRGALKTGKTKHFAALDIKEIPKFLSTLEKNDARLFARTRRAIRLLMLTFTRTTELIHSTWDEFDLENRMWEIPAERMKMGKPHLVPLSRQAVQILKEQKEETGHINTPYVFPGQIKPAVPMSNNTILFGIGRMGYKGRMTGHGFRALAMSTIKEKLGYRHEVVDRQLAHAPRSKVDRAYDRAQFLDQRKVMMQKWSDYLDVVANGKIITGKFEKQHKYERS